MEMPQFLGMGNRYELQAEVGRGGMGVVFRAIDKHTTREVAIKVLLDTSRPEAAEQFDREWKILARLQHTNIVGITDRGEFRDGSAVHSYFVMPFCKARLCSTEPTMYPIRSLLMK